VRVAQRPSQWAAAARCAVEHSDEYLCTGGKLCLPWAYARVSKQAGAFQVHSTFRTCLKKPNPLVFVFYWVLALLGFRMFLFERAVGKLVG